MRHGQTVGTAHLGRARASFGEDDAVWTGITSGIGTVGNDWVFIQCKAFHRRTFIGQCVEDTLVVCAVRLGISPN